MDSFRSDNESYIVRLNLIQIQWLTSIRQAPYSIHFGSSFQRLIGPQQGFEAHASLAHQVDGAAELSHRSV